MIPIDIVGVGVPWPLPGLHSNDMVGVRVSLLGLRRTGMLGDASEYLGVSLVVSCTPATLASVGGTPWPADPNWGYVLECSPDRGSMICWVQGGKVAPWTGYQILLAVRIPWSLPGLLISVVRCQGSLVVLRTASQKLETKGGGRI